MELQEMVTNLEKRYLRWTKQDLENDSSDTEVVRNMNRRAMEDHMRIRAARIEAQGGTPTDIETELVPKMEFWTRVRNWKILGGQGPAPIVPENDWDEVRHLT